MQIMAIRAFSRPHIFNNYPILRMRLDLEDRVDCDTVACLSIFATRELPSTFLGIFVIHLLYV